MNRQLENNETEFYYIVDDLFEALKMRSSYAVNSMYNLSDEGDKYRITEDTRALFSSFLNKIINDVFWHISVWAKDVNDAVKVVDYPYDESGQVVDPSSPLLEATPKPTISFRVLTPPNWEQNMVKFMDETLFRALEYNSMIKLYGVIVNPTIIQLSVQGFEEEVNTLKSILNYRKGVVRRTYRAM